MRSWSLATCVGLAVCFGVALGQEMPKPGPEHALLKQMEGTWDATMKMPVEAGKPAVESKGVMTFKMDLGGFFLTSEFKGEMMGMQFQGRGMSGYDPQKKKYFGTWADSMGPTMMITEGTFDKAGKVLTETGDAPDMTGKIIKWKLVTEIKDKDNMVFTLSDAGKGDKDPGAMVITYKRKK